MFCLKNFCAWRKRKKVFGLRFKCETLIWIVCVLGLTTLTVRQILPLFTKFLTDPPDTSIEIYQNTTLSLPPAAVCLSIGRPPTFTAAIGGQFKPKRYSESPINFWADLLVEDSELDEKCSEFTEGKSISETCAAVGLELQTTFHHECNNVSTTSSIDLTQLSVTDRSKWSKEQNCSGILFLYNRLDTLCIQSMRFESGNSKNKRTFHI